MEREQLRALKQACPMPVLLAKLGLQAHAKASCKSPLRPDNKASWGIFRRGDAWFFKDHGTGECGDEVTFLAEYLKLNEKKEFREIVDAYQKIAKQMANAPETAVVYAGRQQDKLPDRSDFIAGSPQQLEALSKLRGYQPETLDIATRKGQLVFGHYAGNEVYGITDSSGRALELRRLDGKLFPATTALSERKSHTVRFSSKSWPLGLADASDAAMVLFCEGVPDFLAAWQVINVEGKTSTAAPVTMLGAANRISTEALPLFAGKHVRIVPHQDEAGFKAGKLWQQQLREAGAVVDFLDLGRLAPPGRAIKDLDDFKERHAELNGNGTAEGRVL